MFEKNYDSIIVPGKPEIPFVPAYTICTGGETPGAWEQRCEVIVLTMPPGQAIQLPEGATIETIEPQPDGSTKVRVQVCRSEFVPSGPPSPPSCTHYPEQPFVPGEPTREEVRASYGWTVGGNSGVSLDGNLHLEFDMRPVVGVVVGLTTDLDNQADPARIEHGLLFNLPLTGPRFCVIESGSVKTGYTNYVAGDVFAMRRISGIVTYWHNDDLFYTSLRPSSGAVNAGSALYGSGDAVPSEAP